MSATLATTRRRLPGLRFEAQSPPLADSLPPMDVAVFVGFAASGPINVPVVVEDSAQFAEIFGEDALLAWDAERGLPRRAYLGPAVRNFFAQGGKRCWIIRVARDATYNYFPIPALLERRANGDLFPAFARARAEGSWSDALRAGASLHARPVEVTKVSFATHRFELSPNSPGNLKPGDLLRFSLRAEGYGFFCVVESSQPVGSNAKQGRLARRPTVAVQCEKPIWFNTHWLDDLSRRRVSAVSIVNEDGSTGPLLNNLIYWTTSDQGRSITLRFTSSPNVPQPGAKLLIDAFDTQLSVTVQAHQVEEPVLSPARETLQVFGRIDRFLLPRPLRVLVFNNNGEPQPIAVTERPIIEGNEIKLKCLLSLSGGPVPGTVVRVDFEHRQLWLTVRDINSISEASGSLSMVQIEGRGFWPLDITLVLPPDTTVEAECLNFDLLVRESAGSQAALRELGFAEKHSRYWGDWPTDEQRYQEMKGSAFSTPANTNETPTREAFPLAGGHDPSRDAVGREQELTRELYLPLAMPFMAGEFLGAIEQPQSNLERDGLAVFDSDLFLDPDLRDPRVDNVLVTADYLRYQSPRPRALKGIHAAIDLEEATIIAVPDAVHRGWNFKRQVSVPPEAPDRLVHPEWWRYLDCNPSPNQLLLADQPAWKNFLNCDLLVLPAPDLKSEEDTSTGTITLVWSKVAGATRYVVEESRSPAWSGALAIYSGPETRRIIYGRTGGDFYYRVRAEAAGVTSDWSAGITVRTDFANQWQVEEKDEYNASALLDVHRALLRLCAARADLFAVLALPEHYREDDAVTHAELLQPENGSSVSRAAQTVTSLVQPLSLGEERVTSYGALYHPWLVTRRADSVESWQLLPPDGAACGVMAQRALTRGAWSAPANELLRGVVALDPPLAASRRLELQDAQVNVIRQEPRGFLSLTADTLSRDLDLRPINVRRLLILLRRLALRLGENYVFEPNDDSFRRLVQRGFEAALDGMFTRGAFAGSTAATSYQVVTDDSINTPASVDQGRFIVDLRVAPSLPLTFITVRMVQTNDRSSITELR